MQNIEVLAPAGSPEALTAGLEAGADAVYFGLDTLNARRGAINFTPETLQQTVDEVHKNNAKAYLTLNIDIAERELGHAYRMLAHAQSCGVDGVIMRDPALLNVVREFPDLEFHFSTQTSMSSYADIQAAKELGIKRVVLARELTLDEITKESSDPDVETEVFCQGAMCFAFSGRCLLSSWGGGKSGNRGTCASPCRVPWTVDGKRAGRPLSSHDLALVKHIPKLIDAGVASLKIEGRLKKPEWVTTATGIYRRAVDGVNGEELFEEAKYLGNYTGRRLMSDLLDGQRKNLTACTGRDPKTGERRTTACAKCDCFLSCENKTEDSEIEETPEEPESTPFYSDVEEEVAANYSLHISQSKKGVDLTISYASVSETTSISISKIRRPEKATLLSDFIDELNEYPIQDSLPDSVTTDCPEQLLMQKVMKTIQETISKFMYRQINTRKKKLRFPLPDPVQSLLDSRSTGTVNTRKLGDKADTVRIQARDFEAFMTKCSPKRMIVENATPKQIRTFTKKDTELIIALPQVFFDKDQAYIEQQINAAKESGVAIEANSWGGVYLCRKLQVRFSTGYGLQVLNSLTAKILTDLGAESTTYTLEGDQEKLEAISGHTDSALNLVIYGRPPLMVTRFEINGNYMGRTFEDRRELSMIPENERDIIVFRATSPFNISRQKNDEIRAKHLIIDLVNADNPAKEYNAVMNRSGEYGDYLFNYDRKLS